jgi:uncharacterized protein (TIGR02246 family)
MKRALAMVLLGAALTATAAVAAESAGDEAAIRQVTERFVAAWNQNDWKAMAALWAPDGDLINPFGRVASGRAAVEQLFHDEQTGVMKGTTYTIGEQSIRMIAPDVALVEWASTVTGMKRKDGSEAPPFVHHVTVVLKKIDGKWMTEAARPVVYLPPPA